MDLAPVRTRGDRMMSRSRSIWTGAAVWLLFVLVAPVFFPLLILLLPICRLKSVEKRRKRVRPNIVYGPVPIINIKYNSRIDRSFGYKSDTLVYDVYDINKADDFDYVMRFFKNKLLHRLFIRVAAYFVFLWVIWRYDIFQFYFDGGYLSITPLKWVELPILRLAGKRIIVSPYGSDVTMPSKIRNKYKWNQALSWEESYPLPDEERIGKNIEYFVRYADFIIAGGEFVHYLPRLDLWLHFVAVDLDEWRPVSDPGNAQVKVVHATNHRALSGTKYLIAACGELEKEGYPVELVIVERMKNTEARRIYEQADIIVDHLLMWHGMFAVEAMALGKPVLCYLREELINDPRNPYAKDIPIVSSNPDNLKENLTRLIVDKSLRLELGRRGRKYVEKYHSGKYIGSHYDEIYRSLWFGE